MTTDRNDINPMAYPRIREPHERLTWAREQAGFRSARAAAAAIGEAESTYRAYEKDLRRFDADKAISFARAFNVTPQWLLLGTQGADGASLWGRRVPVISHAQATLDSVIQDPYEAEHTRQVVVADASTLSPRAFALDVKYEAMHDPSGPDSFRVGETIVCDPEAKVKPGDFVLAVVSNEEEAVFRRYLARGPSGFELAPLNHAWPTIIVNKRNPGRIIGKVVRHIRAF